MVTDRENRAGGAREGEAPGQEDVENILGDERMSEAEKIRALQHLGFTRKQLMEDFGFSRTNVYRAAPVRPEGKDLKKEEPLDGLPVLRKMGGGVEVLNPEAVLRRYMDGGERDEFELRGMMKLRAAMLMVMDLVNIQKAAAEADALRLQPILRIMEENRKELDAAAARAKASSFEMAQEAAQSAVGGVLGYIDQKIPKGPPPKDTGELLTKRLDKMWDLMEHMMEQRMFPSYQAGKPPEGWEYERLPSPGTPPQETPGGWSREKIKEVSDDEPGDVRRESPDDGAGQGDRPARADGDPEVPQAGAS